MTDLNEQIRQHYRQHSLPAHRLEQLLAQQPQTQPSPPASVIAWPRRLAVAMMLLASSAVVVYYTSIRPVYDLAQGVTREVALNHRKALNLEFLTADYTALNNAMGKLDFTLRLPERLSNQPLMLQGARYCSIQGQIAAQLTFHDGENKRYTLYQTAMTDTLEQLADGELQTEDVVVERWQEGAYFYALAHR